MGVVILGGFVVLVVEYYCFLLISGWGVCLIFVVKFVLVIDFGVF